MPAAAPTPRRPGVLVLGSAENLFSGSPGCAVCRYVAEASGRYLEWFALEAHADPVTITRLCASLGTCAHHTRALASQPGSDIRLTSVYSYVVRAAGAELGARRSRLAPCPACEHDAAAAGRAVGIVVDGLAEPTAQELLPRVAELCYSHLRAAAGSARRRAAGRLRQALAMRTAAGALTVEALAGGPDYDADARADLRATLPPAGNFPPGACRICLAAAHAELGRLVLTAAAGDGRIDADQAGNDPYHGPALCAGHLHDAAAMNPGTVTPLLAEQAACQAEAASRLLARQPGAGRRNRGRRTGSGGLRTGSGHCRVCRARDSAAQQELERCRGFPLGHGSGRGLCVRHVLILRAIDPAAGRDAALAAAERAGALAEELAEAFRKNTWAHRREDRGPEMAAWRRAAAFLDGSVFGGCLPGDQ